MPLFLFNFNLRFEELASSIPKRDLFITRAKRV